MNLVSVVIPVYNVRQYVRDCLESVARQTYSNVECLIIDDCSTDDSMSIVSDFLNQYKGHILFRVINHPRNLGLSKARNTGINNIKGDFIYFLDSDDVISEDCLRVLVDTQLTTKADIVVGSHMYMKNDGTSINYCVREPIGDIFMSCDVDWYGHAWNKLIRSNFLKSHSLHFESGIYHEDILWTYQLLCKSPKVGFSEALTYYYKERESSIMSKRDNAIIAKRFVSYQLILDKMKSEIPINQADRIGALFLLERTARMMSFMMLGLDQKEKAQWLFDYAKNKVSIPVLFLFRPSSIRIRDKVKMIYRILPFKLAFRLFSSLSRQKR